jgi:hypothetical protein
VAYTITTKKKNHQPPALNTTHNVTHHRNNKSNPHQKIKPSKHIIQRLLPILRWRG